MVVVVVVVVVVVAVAVAVVVVVVVVAVAVEAVAVVVAVVVLAAVVRCFRRCNRTGGCEWVAPSDPTNSSGRRQPDAWETHAFSCGHACLHATSGGSSSTG